MQRPYCKALSDAPHYSTDQINTFTLFTLLRDLQYQNANPSIKQQYVSWPAIVKQLHIISQQKCWQWANSSESLNVNSEDSYEYIIA